MEHVYQIDGVGSFTDRAEYERALDAYIKANPEKASEYRAKVADMMSELRRDLRK